jgi:hypothetical protein
VRVISPAPHFSGDDHQANMKKGQEPFSVPALSLPSELVEHSPMHRMDHPSCEVRRQGVIVALVEREVPQFIVFNDVLVEEAAQRAPFGGGESVEVAL